MSKYKAMLERKRWAVLGASANPSKFGYRIFKLLLRYGYEVYPVNPRETEIDGLPCFPSLLDLPVIPDVVDFVVPPAVALVALEDCKRLGIKNVWLQPGVNTPEVIAKAELLGLTFIADRCAMVESSKPAMLEKKNWVVVGVEDQKAEVQQLVTHMKDRGYTVSLLIVEDLGKETAPKPVFAALEQKPEVTLIVGSPNLTAKILREAKQVGIEYIWLQPGSETDELIALGNELNLVVVHHFDVMDE